MVQISSSSETPTQKNKIKEHKSPTSETYNSIEFYSGHVGGYYGLIIISSALFIISTIIYYAYLSIMLSVIIFLSIFFLIFFNRFTYILDENRVVKFRKRLIGKSFNYGVVTDNHGIERVILDGAHFENITNVNKTHIGNLEVKTSTEISKVGNPYFIEGGQKRGLTIKNKELANKLEKKIIARKL